MPGKESDMNNRKIFTSESVTQGHPDKLCDLVSDSVLDAVLEQDPMGRVACETAATTGMVLVMGEITTSARIDIAQIARKAICDAGYDRPEWASTATAAMSWSPWGGSPRISPWALTTRMTTARPAQAIRA